MSQSYRLQISGMSCEECVARVEEALKGVSGVDSVDIQLESGEATVEAQTNADLVPAVTNAGYEATLI